MMDVMNNGCILPSNAPSFEGLGIITRGVLQERCNNRRDDPHVHQHFDDGYHGLKQEDPRMRVEPAFLSHIFQPFQHNLQTREEQDKELQIQQQTRAIYERALAYKPYFEYRENQRKRSNNGAKGGDVWTEQKELAFWRGIITYAPCGRKQQPYIYPDGTRSKPMGRNELISAVIVEVTGDARVRKQISSHLQVVRAKLAADPWLGAQLISPEGGKKPNGAAERRRERPHRSQHKKAMRARHRAEHDAYASIYGTEIPGVVPLQHAVPNPHAFRRFGILIKDTRTKIEHHITQMNDPQDPQPSAQLDDLPVSEADGLLLDFPDVRKLLTEGSLQGSQLIHARATIDFCTLQDLSLAGKEVGIHFFLESDPSWDVQNFSELSSTITFYEGGSAATSISDPILKSDRQDAMDLIPFASKFWVSKIKTISQALVDAKRSRKAATQSDLTVQSAETQDRMAKHFEFQAAECVQKLTAIQEVRGSLVGAPKESYRILTLCWTFARATDGRDGEMTWRNITLPSAQAPHDSVLMDQDPFMVTANTNLHIHTHMLPDLTHDDSLSAPHSASFLDEHHLGLGHPMHHGLTSFGHIPLADNVNIAHDPHHSFYSSRTELSFDNDHVELCMDGAPPALGSLPTGLGASAHFYPTQLTQPDLQHALYDYQPVTQHQVHMPPTSQPYIGPYLQPSPFEDRPSLKHHNSYHDASLVHTPIQELDLKFGVDPIHAQSFSNGLTLEDGHAHAGADEAHPAIDHHEGDDVCA